MLSTTTTSMFLVAAPGCLDTSESGASDNDDATDDTEGDFEDNDSDRSDDDSIESTGDVEEGW